MENSPTPPAANRRVRVSSPEERADLLKERVYVSFTALAVVIALDSHPVEESSRSVALTLLVTVLGTLLAVFLADLISHVSVRGLMPTRHEFRHMLDTSLGSLGTVAIPLILVGIAGVGLISVQLALRLSEITLLGSLLVVGFLAVRRARITVWKRIILLLSEAALGAVVIGLQLISHG